MNRHRETEPRASSHSQGPPQGPDCTAPDTPPVQWRELGHLLGPSELAGLKKSIVEMAVSRVDGEDELYVGGLWALRRSDSLAERGITSILSLVSFNPSTLKNFKEEPWEVYGQQYRHLSIDVNDMDDVDILVELPRAVSFIDQGLRGHDAVWGEKDRHPDQESGLTELARGVKDMNLEVNGRKRTGGVFVHCAMGKSRSATAVVAYLLWRYPKRFDPRTDETETAKDDLGSPPRQSRKESAAQAVAAALAHVRKTRPMAEPNPGFMQQLELWWEMGCPADVEGHPAYQRWAYKREVEEFAAVGQAPSRLRFEDEVRDESSASSSESGSGNTTVSLRCKKCRRTLATSQYIIEHQPTATSGSSGDQAQAPCQHIFIEPLSWMRPELEKGSLNGRLLCPNERCGAGVGRYDWKGFRCSCGGWVTPGLSLQRARIDESVVRGHAATAAASAAAARGMGIRMPPGSGQGRGGNL